MMMRFPRPAQVLGFGAISAGLVMAGLFVPASASAEKAPGAESALLPNIDVRDAMKPATAPTAAASRLESSLGDGGFLSTDPQTGSVAFLGTSDGFLTAASKADPADIVTGYVRDHRAAFGISAADLATLGTPDSYTSLDGVTHVSIPQVVAGIESYDTPLMGNVDAKGRLINISGTPAADLSLATTQPTLSAQDALLAARANVGGSQDVPAVTAKSAGADQGVTYATYGESAKLVAFATPGQDRLAWEVGVLDDASLLYRVVVDAATGKVLARQSLTAFDSNDAAVWPNFPSAVQAPLAANFGTDPTWLDRSAANGNQLIGNNAHAYHDDNGTNGYQAGEEVVRNPGTTTWTYPMTWFNQAGCPAFACTWNSAVAGSRTTNRSAGTVGLFYLTNHFHDYLLGAPIGFDEASRNFEQVNSTGQGLGGDAVLAESQDSSGTNNANFSTPADGTPGRMQMYVWDGTPGAVGPQYDVDGSASAEVVYHEYTHGLSNRLVGNGGGLGALQSGAMGEGWSDFYALDLLVAEGNKPDPAGPGDVWMGEYATGVPGIFGGISRIRHQAIDCTVGAAAALCPASGTAGSGGYTLGDLGHVGTTNGVHDGGEIWSQTMWDLRTALGRTDALRIITGGMRLSPANPSMLNMRDAILQSANVSGVNLTTVWQVFAARGFGYFASTPDATANSATEDFSMPPALVHTGTTVNDAAPRGDGDGRAEPGETLEIASTLQNLTTNPISDVTGVASATNGVNVTRANSSWPSIAPGAQVANTPPFAVTIPDIQPCGTTFSVSVAVTTSAGAVTIPARNVAVEGTPAFTAATDVPQTIPDNTPAGVNSLFTFPGAGTVTDMDVRIGSLTHTWVGDLRITLNHGATTVVLMNRPGAGTNGSSGDNFTNLVLDDEATAPIEGISNTPPAGGFTGSYTPDQPLSAFDGQSLAGVWTLNVSDNAAADTGTLQSWALSPVSNCQVFALPTATTEPASLVTHDGAQLNGSVDANGHATDYRFEYGTTISYGSSTAITAGGSGADPVAVSASVSGLTPSTPHHYRLVALRGGVVVATGADQTFTTLALPGAVTEPATDVIETAATLNGSLDANGAATDYQFEYGTTTSYGSTTPVAPGGSGADPVAEQADIAGLTPDTPYHFRLLALRGGVVVATGADETFTTLALPGAVTEPATNVSEKAARLHGSLEANGTATDYQFEYGTTTSYGSTTPPTAGGSGTVPEPVTADISGLTGATPYHFRLVALRDGVVLATGADQTFTTAAPAPIPPTPAPPTPAPTTAQPVPTPSSTVGGVVTLQATSVFRTNSAKLTKAGKKALRILVGQVPPQARPTTVVTGQIRATKATKAERKRAIKRAKAVAKYLRTLRLPGSITAASVPAAVASTKKVNTVGITITYVP